MSTQDVILLIGKVYITERDLMFIRAHGFEYFELCK